MYHGVIQSVSRDQLLVSSSSIRDQIRDQIRDHETDHHSNVSSVIISITVVMQYIMMHVVHHVCRLCTGCISPVHYTSRVVHTEMVVISTVSRYREKVWQPGTTSQNPIAVLSVSARNGRNGVTCYLGSTSRTHHLSHLTIHHEMYDVSLHGCWGGCIPSLTCTYMIRSICIHRMICSTH